MKDFISSLGPVSAIIGAQWGDEGKGKATDILAEHFDVLARAAGGANAGHTIVINGEKTVFHLLPSGCLHKGKTIVLGAGMVIHLPTLVEEIEMVEGAGVDITKHLHIAASAHILFDYHKELDALMEEQRSKSKGEGIGTTKRGIGPAYMDKAARTGIRMEQLLLPKQELKELVQHRIEVVQKYEIPVNLEQELEHLMKAKHLLEGCIIKQVPSHMAELLDQKKTILIEGAQATLLDIDHGTYPYVTSSSTTITGALQALGMPPQTLSSCIGVAKAYCTRVGGGGFTTEANEEDGQRLRDKGGEYGATTGRPRRCGWLSIPDLVYATTINGFHSWNITKLDVLDDEEQIPVCVDVTDVGEPAYENLPGWQSSTVGLTSFDELPDNAKNYLKFIEDKTKVPVSLIGTGPDREHMIVKS